jgi:hypothetical protein
VAARPRAQSFQTASVEEEARKLPAPAAEDATEMQDLPGGGEDHKRSVTASRQFIGVTTMEVGDRAEDGPKRMSCPASVLDDTGQQECQHRASR